MTMQRPDPINWKMIRISEDTHAVLSEMKRPQESYNKLLTRLVGFYGDMLFDDMKGKWMPIEANVR
ncbi:MAG: DUF7557 family protein [Candidatus Thorarchaeota archaeon]